MTTSREKVRAAQDLVEVADRHGTLAEKVRARDVLISAATFFGRPDISLVAFNWNLAHAPEFDGREDECWLQFRWIAQDILSVPTVSLGEIEHVLEMMEHFWDVFRFSEYAYTLARAAWADFRSAPPEEIERWSKRTLRWYDECGDIDIYDIQSMFECYFFIKDWDRCREIALEIFESGKVVEETPHTTYCESLALFHDDRNFAQAEICYTRGYDMCRNTPVFLRQIADVMIYGLRTGREDDATEMVIAHFPWTQNTVDGWGELRFFTAADIVIRHFEWTRERRERLSRLTGCPFETLGGSFRERSDTLIQQFDARHGNSAIKEWAKELREEFGV